MADKIQADGSGIVKTFVDMGDGTFAERVDTSGSAASGEATVTESVKATTVSAPAQTVVGTSAIAILAANADRKRVSFQNTGTTVIYLAFGATNPTTTAYHVALAPGAAADDGSGAFYSDEMIVQEVRALSSAAGGTVVITEVE